MTEQSKQELLEEYRNKLITVRKKEAQHQEFLNKSKDSKDERISYENQINALRSVGQKIAEVYRPLENGRYIVKVDMGGRYVVSARDRIDPALLKNGTRVALDKETLTIMHVLGKEVDPQVFHMQAEDPGNISYTDIGGLGDQLNEIREVIELPLVNKEIFQRVGIKAPKGALLYGPPGTGKTLIARAIAHSVGKVSFLKVVSTNLIASYIGESARLIREMFEYARAKQPTIIFIDEIDAIGAKRMGEGQTNDRETQRTLMELLAQMDGFEANSQVKVIMATNRPDVLDPALLRPGRLDRKIEIPLPNEQARSEIIKIHSRKLNKSEEIDVEALVKLSEGFNGADLRNICTEAGLFALREGKDSVSNDDFMKAVRTIKKQKSLESTLHYEKI